MDREQRLKSIDENLLTIVSHLNTISYFLALIFILLVSLGVVYASS